MPEPTMPPITIMVASKTPSNCRGLTGSKGGGSGEIFVKPAEGRLGSRLDRDHLTTELKLNSGEMLEI